MLKIYGGPTFNVLKVVLVAEEAGMDYEYIFVNLAEGAQKSPEHMQRHALGKVPAIEHDGKALFESAAISRYLAKVSGSTLYTGDDYQLAVIDQWVDMMSAHAGRWLGAVFFQEFVRPNYMQQEPDAAVLAEAKGFLKDQLPAVDKQLADNVYLAGDILTIADLFAFSYFQTHEKTSVELGEYSNIVRWYNAINQRPSASKATSVVNG